MEANREGAGLRGRIILADQHQAFSLLRRFWLSCRFIHLILACPPNLSAEAPPGGTKEERLGDGGIPDTWNFARKRVVDCAILDTCDVAGLSRRYRHEYG